VGSGVDDLRRQVGVLAVSGLPLEVLWRRADVLLRRTVPWDASAWGTVDPATLLSTSCLVLGAGQDPERESAVFALEHDEREPLRLLDLAARTPPAGALHDATGGRPEAAPRWARVLQPLGFADDLRVALVRGGVCWGSLYAYRRGGAFLHAEVALLGAVAEDLADAVRLTLLRDAAVAGADDEEQSPGLLLVAPDGAVTAATAPGHRWLAALRGARGDVPPVVTALAASLRADVPGPASARLQVADGRWVVLHASGLPDGGCAVIVELARPVVVAEVLAAAYGFTARERDVVGLVLRGAGNRAIAAELGISEHTVKEHVTSVFAKAGVVSRAELAATLLREQYLPRRGVLAPSPSGFFRASA
jgi:DNA-binding CsgD family transcriptional regulator